MSIADRVWFCCFWLSCLLLMSSGCHHSTVVTPTTPVATSGTVTLRIEYGDDRPAVEYSIPWTTGLTPFKVLEGAEKLGLSSERSGTGERAFVRQIGEFANESAKDGKYWLFFVNGKEANVGADIYTLQQGDAMIWKFQRYSQ